jgi:hypothetical protein
VFVFFGGGLIKGRNGGENKVDFETYYDLM